MKSLILIGGGGHCRSCLDVIEAEGRFKVTGVVERDDADYVAGAGLLLLGSDEDLPNLVAKYKAALITVGQIKTPEVRKRLFERLQELSADFPVIVSPYGYVSPNARIGAGTIVMHGALVNTQAIVGENCIINSHALLEHDARVDSHCHISTGAKINGGAHIGAGVFVGSGAIVGEDISIGSGCIVGAGTVVLSDLPVDTIYHSGR